MTGNVTLDVAVFLDLPQEIFVPIYYVLANKLLR